MEAAIRRLLANIETCHWGSGFMFLALAAAILQTPAIGCADLYYVTRPSAAIELSTIRECERRKRVPKQKCRVNPGNAGGDRDFPAATGMCINAFVLALTIGEYLSAYICELPIYASGIIVR